jgi:hypothetical protein
MAFIFNWRCEMVQVKPAALKSEFYGAEEEMDDVNTALIAVGSTFYVIAEVEGVNTITKTFKWCGNTLGWCKE